MSFWCLHWDSHQARETERKRQIDTQSIVESIHEWFFFFHLHLVYVCVLLLLLVVFLNGNSASHIFSLHHRYTRQQPRALHSVVKYRSWCALVRKTKTHSQHTRVRYTHNNNQTVVARETHRLYIVRVRADEDIGTIYRVYVNPTEKYIYKIKNIA